MITEKITIDTIANLILDGLIALLGFILPSFKRPRISLDLSLDSKGKKLVDIINDGKAHYISEKQCIYEFRYFCKATFSNNSPFNAYNVKILVFQPIIYLDCESLKTDVFNLKSAEKKSIEFTLRQTLKMTAKQSAEFLKRKKSIVDDIQLLVEYENDNNRKKYTYFKISGTTLINKMLSKFRANRIIKKMQSL